MELPRRLKDLAYPARGELVPLRFREDGWMTALVPDDEIFGLTRELVLQRVYDELAGDGGRRLVVDAGAHVGLFSMIASRNAERVVSLEPDPANFRLLEQNRELNDARNITAINAALWTEAGEVSFAPSWHTTGGNVEEGGEERVAARSIDDLVEEFGEIDLLKLDVEGAEFEVLPSARRLARVRTLVGELHFRDEADRDRLVNVLEDRGFDVTVISAPSLYRPSWIPTVIRNWRRVHGQLKVKLGVLAYLLAPVEKPRRPPGSRDMPLFVAQRRSS